MPKLVSRSSEGLVGVCGDGKPVSRSMNLVIAGIATEGEPLASESLVSSPKSTFSSVVLLLHLLIKECTYVREHKCIHSKYPIRHSQLIRFFTRRVCCNQTFQVLFHSLPQWRYNTIVKTMLVCYCVFILSLGSRYRNVGKTLSSRERGK